MSGLGARTDQPDSTGAIPGLPPRPDVTPSAMTIDDAVLNLGDGQLTESSVVRHLWPLFSRASKRREIYLANHSLGRPLDRMASDVSAALDLW